MVAGRSIREHVVHSFRYDPSIRAKLEKEDAARAADSSVVVLAPFVVEELKENRPLEHAMEKQKAEREALKPSVERGISVPGHRNMGILPYDDLFPSNNPTPRWTIFKLP